MTLAYIRWKDACQEAADDPAIPEIDTTSPLVELEEVGWLIDETPESVSIGMEHDVASQTYGRWRLHIPRVNILELRTMDLSKFPKRKRKI